MSFFPGVPNGYLPRQSRTASLFSGPAQSADTSEPAGVHDPQFDIFEWHPAYLSCQRYFLDHAQHEGSVQALAALVNISLPFQWTDNPIMSSSGHTPPNATGPSSYSMPWPRQGPVHSSQRQGQHISVSLVPYIRRLVVTGFDTRGILHGFFGDDWKKGVGPVQDCERRNYLFAAKSVGWAKVKYQYDMSPHETVPFLKPLQNVELAEIESAEKTWSQWLAMEDWMVGPRAPETMEESSGSAARRSQEN